MVNHGYGWKTRQRILKSHCWYPACLSPRRLRTSSVQFRICVSETKTLNISQRRLQSSFGSAWLCFQGSYFSLSSCTGDGVAAATDKIKSTTLKTSAFSPIVGRQQFLFGCTFASGIAQLAFCTNLSHGFQRIVESAIDSQTRTL